MKISLNPDQEFVAEIRRQLRENNGYCPCQLQKTKDTKCKCLEFRTQLENGIEGPCHCGLWVAEKE